MSQLTSSTAVTRALRLRCPRCGEGKLFRGVLSMLPKCSHCGFVFQRAPGYFLGSTYLNYGFTAMTLTALYMVLHFGYGYSNEFLTPFLTAYCVVVPIIFFRYARSWWLAMDCMIDSTGFHEPQRLVPESRATPSVGPAADLAGNTESREDGSGESRPGTSG